MRKIILPIIATVIFMTVVITVNSVNAQENSVPSWIKNTMGFWVNGQVSDNEFLNAVQFLANEGIIQVSSAQTDTPPFKTYTVEKEINRSVGTLEFDQVFCENNDIVLSGGYLLEGQSLARVNRAIEDKGWEIWIATWETGRVGGTVYAYCLDLTP